MPLQRGKDMVVSVDDGTGSLVPIGGLRARSIRMAAPVVDASTADGHGWRRLVPAASLRSIAISGDGLFVNDDAINQVRSLFFGGETANWKFVLPGEGYFLGAFQIARMDFKGDDRGESEYAISVESSGPVSYVVEGS